MRTSSLAELSYLGLEVFVEQQWVGPTQFRYSSYS